MLSKIPRKLKKGLKYIDMECEVDSINNKVTNYVIIKKHTKWSKKAANLLKQQNKIKGF